MKRPEGLEPSTSTLGVLHSAIELWSQGQVAPATVKLFRLFSSFGRNYELGE